MMDIINPWGALRRAQRLIAELIADNECLEQEAEADYRLYVELRERLADANAKIAEGHFRNPKTGRIGPMGETFDV